MSILQYIECLCHPKNSKSIPASKDASMANMPASLRGADLRFCHAGMVSSSLELHRYATDRQTRVVTALTLLKTHLFKCVIPAQKMALSCGAPI